MQISPTSNPTWANPAAASQQASSEQRTPTGGANGAGNPQEVIVDVERSTEILDRDANGQYGGSPENPNRDEPHAEESAACQSMLELPAENDAEDSTLDLMG